MNAASPLDVSVVMPTWNRPQMLRASVDAVLAQTAAFRELILADDGSDAPTRALLEQYAALPRVRLLQRRHCGNPGEVRNAAIREATGRYIAFADSDDLWHERKLELQLAALAARPDCRWSYTASSGIDAQDRPITPGKPNHLWRTNSLLESLATFSENVALPTVVAERSLLFAAGLFDESLGCYEDYDLWLRLAALSDAVTLPEPLVRVRLHAHHFSRGNHYTSLSGRLKFLTNAINRVRTPAVRAGLQRARALDSARLASIAAQAGDADAAVLRLRASFAHGWVMPRWWLIAAKAHSHMWSLRVKRLREQRS